jgi:hypothetical protein
MTNFENHIRNSAAFFSIAVIYLFSATVIFAQCEGVYFKPTGKTVTDPRIFIYELQEDIAGDMNGDGKLDLVAAEYTAQNVFNKLFIYPGDGAGGFGTRTEITLAESLDKEYRSYYVRDFNGDNKLDLIVRGTSNFRVYLNSGTGAFTPLALTPAAGDLINVVDINNDSRKDLIVVLGGAHYQLGNADGSFGDRVQLPQINFTGRFGGDFDGDGDTDFASTAVIGTTNVFRVVYNQGGVFAAGNQSVTLDAGNNGIDTVGDLNNDGKPDVILSNAGNPPKLTILLNQGNGNFTKTDFNRDSSLVYYPSHLGDFNGDGFVDILTRVRTQPNNDPSGYVISLNNGAGAFTQRTYVFGTGLDLYKDRLVGDFTGDGKPDFIRINNAGQSAWLSMSVFNETQFTVKTNVCNKFGQPKIVDFDRDGKTDQTLWRASDGHWRFRYNGTSVGSFVWGAPDDKLVPGDYDGDGATDAAVFRNGVWYILNSSNNSMTAVNFGAGTDKPIPADYNGDGRTDLAVFRPSNGTWYFLTSGSNQFSAAQFGIAEDVPLPEDYDGDEKADLAVFRPSQGNWYILRSSDNGFRGITWGLSTDKPYPADYDGDGKADLCVRRESNSNWYILRSSNNQWVGYLFGFSTDIAQTGDWDGNGIMDIGVYRPNTGRWYASSLYGANLPVFGEAGETPIASIQR